MEIDKNKTYYTRDGEEIPGDKVWELDSEGYVISSFRWTTIDFAFGKN